MYKQRENKGANKTVPIEKLSWKGGNMVYPLPAVMVSCGNQCEKNIITIGWTGTICTNPPMLYVSIRPERYSYKLIEETRELVVNLTTEELAFQTDYCGVKSGRSVDKWSICGLTAGEAKNLNYAPIIMESPVNIECKVRDILELGSHHMFICDVQGIQVSEALMGDDGKFMLNNSGLLAYSHGEYISLGESLGTFGYSVRKKSKKAAAQGFKKRGKVPERQKQHFQEKGKGNNKEKGRNTEKNRRSTMKAAEEGIDKHNKPKKKKKKGKRKLK